jgi:hypothetical protein
MKHPNQATLALHAGGDLNILARWRTGRHLAQCAVCRDELAAFEAVREIAPELREIPEIPWQRLAAEMKANIRLGLEAGECVRPGEKPLRETRWFTGARTAVAFASMVALVVTGLVLERPAPRDAASEGRVAETTAYGIQLSEDGQAMGLLHAGAQEQNVTSTVSARGGVRERYVDPETGYVTINNVDAQ